MTVATRTGFELEAAIESFRRNQRTRLASQTLDRLYIPRLNKLAFYLRVQGMPTDVGSIRREHLESYIEWLQHSAPGRTGVGQKSATVSISYRTMRTFFNWLVKEDELRKSPMDRVQAPSVVEEAPLVLTSAQLERMYKVCAGRGFEDRRDLALLRLLADSGMRRGEVAGLTVDDLHLEGDGLILLRGGTSKGRRDRLVPVSRQAGAALDRYLRVRHSHPHAAEPSLWLGKRGRLTDSGILQVVERRGREVGIPGVHPHRFRHTFAHGMKMKGVTDGSLMLIGGWKDPAMLARYGRSAAAEAAVAEFRRLDG